MYENKGTRPPWRFSRVPAFFHVLVDVETRVGFAHRLQHRVQMLRRVHLVQRHALVLACV